MGSVLVDGSSVHDGLLGAPRGVSGGCASSFDRRGAACTGRPVLGPVKPLADGNRRAPRRVVRLGTCWCGGEDGNAATTRRGAPWTCSGGQTDCDQCLVRRTGPE